MKELIVKTHTKLSYGKESGFFTSTNKLFNCGRTNRMSVSKLIKKIGVNKLFKIVFEELPYKTLEEAEYFIKKIKGDLK